MPAPQSHPGASRPARPPRSPGRRRGVTPISGPRACSLRADGPGPGPRSAHGAREALTLHGAGEALALVGRVHGRRRGVLAGDGVGGTGLHGSGLFLYFSTPPRLPSPNSGGGRTDVKRAPLPLPRGRSARRPGPAAPRLQGAAHSTVPAGPGRAGPEGPGRRPGVREGRADTGGRAVPTPAALRSGPMRSASPARAPLHLPPWARVPEVARQPRRWEGGWVAERAASGCGSGWALPWAREEAR